MSQKFSNWMLCGVDSVDGVYEIRVIQIDGRHLSRDIIAAVNAAVKVHTIDGKTLLREDNCRVNIDDNAKVIHVRSLMPLNQLYFILYQRK